MIPMKPCIASMPVRPRRWSRRPFPAPSVDGAVDRAALARQRVIGKPEALKHARSRSSIRWCAPMREAFLARHRAAGTPLVVLDIPLLFETGGRDRVDKVVVVTAPAEVQRAARAGTPGHDRGKIRGDPGTARCRTPRSVRMADFVIDTGQGMEAARDAVAAIIADLSGGKTGIAPA